MSYEQFEATAIWFDGTAFGGYRHYSLTVWMCPYCQSRNRHDRDQCWYCGAPRRDIK